MQSIARLGIILGFLFCLCFPALAAEEAAPVPDKAGLISFWEKSEIKDPHVQRFEKTKEEGVYDFATDFFPYKGRLKLLNAVVTKSNESYLEGLYTGIIELELMDAPPDFFKKYAASYGAWTQQHYFYYAVKKGVWFPMSEWSAYSADLYKSAEPAASGCPLTSQLSRYAGTWLPVLVLLVLVAFVFRFARRQNAKIWENHAKALAEQQRGLKIAEESLKHQLEHTQLLKEIVGALKK
ncbi:MAG: hypothetical protein EPN97_05665 [Alphaproteobacteria bacterium]|nr:MAG: hypothetical protein EPN97_05665 [Alphaproteobacteria bacterium]